MILDGHIHCRDVKIDDDAFSAALECAGVTGGLVISLPPPAFPKVAPSLRPAERIENVLAWCRGDGNRFPFYWIDPLEYDAEKQVESAAAAGVMGFKVICDRYFPGDQRAMRVFEAIAATGKPILFHAGILWDGKSSSRYNRPAEFESLLDVRGLRFSLAHMAWPWCDELIAVYGKFLNALGRDPDAGVEMFIDTTPGTPPIYRAEALTRLFGVGYDVAQNVIFGSDSCTNAYNPDWTRQWVEKDNRIFKELNVSRAAVAAVFVENLKRFVGITPSQGPKRAPQPGV